MNTDPSKSFKFIPPKDIIVGDIVDYNIQGQLHPVIIIKVIDKQCFGVVLTTKNNDYCTLSKIENSRVFSESYFSCTIIGLTVEYALTRWRGVFDNPKEIKRVKTLLKQNYKNILK
jgi:hypothetical protein